MPPTLTDRVRHILTAIADIDSALHGKTLEDYSLTASCSSRSSAYSKSSARHRAISRIPSMQILQSPGRGWLISATGCGTLIIGLTPRSCGMSSPRTFRH
jgi:hypothetical protein